MQLHVEKAPFRIWCVRFINKCFLGDNNQDFDDEYHVIVVINQVVLSGKWYDRDPEYLAITPGINHNKKTKTLEQEQDWCKAISQTKHEN